jgi:hypothetical protein
MSLLQNIPGLAAHKTAAPALQVVRPAEKPAEVRAGELPRHLYGTSRFGRPFVVASMPEHVARLRAAYPAAGVFTQREMDALHGMTPAEADPVLMLKAVFGAEGIEIERVRLIGARVRRRD